jgi:hypothetical protein
VRARRLGAGAAPRTAADLAEILLCRLDQQGAERGSVSGVMASGNK